MLWSHWWIRGRNRHRGAVKKLNCHWVGQWPSRQGIPARVYRAVGAGGAKIHIGREAAMVGSSPRKIAFVAVLEQR